MESEKVEHLLKLKKTLLLEETQLKARLNDIIKWREQIQTQLKQNEYTPTNDLLKQRNLTQSISKEHTPHLKQPTENKNTIMSVSTPNSKSGDVTVGGTPTDKPQTKSNTDTANTSSQYFSTTPLQSLRWKVKKQ